MIDTAAPPSTVLVVDDEPNIRDLLSQMLRLVGFDVRTAATGFEALTAAEEAAPAIIILDVTLPDIDGLEVAGRLRAAGHDMPVLFLTARDTLEDRIAGLTAGGDDYVTKPFSLEEVVLRIRAILRRTQAAREAPESKTGDDVVLRYADLELHEAPHEVRRAGQLIDLSPTEFKLLTFLLENAGRVVGRAQIVDRVWGYDFGGDSRIVESYIYYLRKKIDPVGPPLLHTVRGVGYTLRLPRDGG